MIELLSASALATVRPRSCTVASAPGDSLRFRVQKVIR